MNKKKSKVILQHDIRFKCYFCNKIFKKSSECAKHIEKESMVGICFPGDIIITKEEDKNNAKNKS